MKWAGLALGSLFVLAGCSGLGNASYGILPEDVHKKPTPQEVAADPCKHGDVHACIDRCKNENARACNLVGIMFEFDPNTDGDPSMASGFYRRACDAAYAPGCNNLAWLYLSGRGVPKDHPQAMRLFSYAYDAAQIACHRGDPSSCLLAGELLQDGHVDRDGANAVAFFARACDGGEKRGCELASNPY
jgi:TPR repeat protein